MDHTDLKDKILKAVGGVPPMPMRETWAEFLTSQGTEFYLNYDWIKDNRFLKWISDSPDVDFGEGSQGVSVWIVRFGRINHER